MPRPQKPIEQKRRTGNPGKRPLPSQANLAVVPELSLPEWSKDPGAVFEQVLEDGVTWLAQTDAPTVALLHSMLEERGEVFAAVKAGGPRKDLRELDKQIITLLGQLGFDPAARSRLGLAEVKARSKLEDLEARRSKRAKG